MTDLQTCAACDHTGFDVKVKLVRLDPPWLSVHDPISGQSMPEKFRREPRCTDPETCRSRQENHP